MNIFGVFLISVLSWSFVVHAENNLCKESQQLEAKEDETCRAKSTGVYVWYSQEEKDFAEAQRICDAGKWARQTGWHLSSVEELTELSKISFESGLKINFDDFIWITSDGKSKVNAFHVPTKYASVLELQQKNKFICISDGLPTGMRFVKIPTGSFWMGSPDDEIGRGQNETRSVRLVPEFFMQTTEVTQQQWFEVMGDNPSRFSTKNICPDEYQELVSSIKKNLTVRLCPRHPVDSVSWNDVSVFLDEINRRSRNGFYYDLPTEEEWEYAARAGTRGEYGIEHVSLDQFAWYKGNSKDKTHPVAKLKPNGWGLYDMHGNLNEWTGEFYWIPGENGFVKTNAIAVRGGDFASPPNQLRSALRVSAKPYTSYATIGFRLIIRKGSYRRGSTPS